MRRIVVLIVLSACSGKTGDSATGAEDSGSSGTGEAGTAAEDGTTGTVDTDAGEADSSTTSAESDAESESGSESDGDEDDTSSSGTCGSVLAPLETAPVPCDWEMCDPTIPGECGRGSKCSAISCDPCDAQPHSTACKPAYGEQDVGQPCIAGSGGDGCLAGLACVVMDPDGTGYCAPFCQGPELDCEDPETSCQWLFSGLMPVCLAQCDDNGECPEGSACFGVAGPDVCVPGADAG